MYYSITGRKMCVLKPILVLVIVNKNRTALLSNSYNTLTRDVSDLQSQRLWVKPKGGVIVIRYIPTWACYQLFCGISWYGAKSVPTTGIQLVVTLPAEIQLICNPGGL